MKKIIAIIMTFMFVAVASAQSTKFTYQGKLSDNSLPANGTYELQFKVYDTSAVGTGTLIDNQVRTVNATVVNGIFTVELDFGDRVFTGNARFLEISVRRQPTDAFQTLSPRQEVTSSPYAIRALNAQTAQLSVDTAQLGGVEASQYVLTTDTRMTDDRNPLAGSANYIQNGISLQPSSNFNISGDGRADSFSANTQFNIGFDRILGRGGVLNLFVGTGQSNTIESDFNTFVGITAGRDATTGDGNTFLGSAAGRATTTGSSNTFLGRSAGINNVGGGYNSFVGKEAGFFNTTGNFNTFLGGQSGLSNTTGAYNTFSGYLSGLNNGTASYGAFFGAEAGRENNGNANSFFGSSSGRQNTTGTNNAFFGADSGRFNSTGINNAFFGTFSGMNTQTGSGNTFVGVGAGLQNVGGNSNTLLGADSNLGSANLTNASAIGANAMVSQSNSMVLGNNVNVGIGTSTPTSRLTVAGLIETTTPGGGIKFADGTVQTTAASTGSFIRNSVVPQVAANFNLVGTGRANILSANDQFDLGGEKFISRNGFANTFVGLTTGTSVTTGISNTFIGNAAGVSTTTGGKNTFVGDGAGLGNRIGQSNTFLGAGAGSFSDEGSSNVGVGVNAGNINRFGSGNVYIGARTGNDDEGFNNTLIGSNAQTETFQNILRFATAIGSNSVVTTDNTIVLGRPGGEDKVRVPGLGTGGTLALCRNASNEISTCAALADGAPSAAKIAEQDARINEQQKIIERQQKQIDALMKIVCAQNSEACKEEEK